jgi:hypothetical protein
MAEITRRDTLKQGLTWAGFLALAEWARPALAQEGTDVPFTDYPPTFKPDGDAQPVREAPFSATSGVISWRESFNPRRLLR